jgi:ArsR family transcriptional regulator, arsenate/arsenite/antimonite-responsive transcriptional repressor
MSVRTRRALAGVEAAGCCAALTAAQLSEADATLLAPLFAALADPVRLRLFTIIASEGEVCSCNLEAPLRRSQPTASHHTRILAEAGWIEVTSAVGGCGGECALSGSIC